MTTPRNRAIQLATRVQLSFAVMESALAEGADMADEAGEGDIAATIRSLAEDIASAHTKAAALAVTVAHHYGDGDNVRLWSGGDRKPDPNPPADPPVGP